MTKEQVDQIKHSCEIMREMALHSKSMSHGMKQVINRECAKILTTLEEMDDE